MEDDDKSKGPLWPLQVQVALGGMATVAEMAGQTGISENEMVTTLKFLEEQGCAKMMLVPICPDCESMMDKYEAPEDLPDVGSCPVCGVTWPMIDGEVRVVYIITKWPD